MLQCVPMRLNRKQGSVWKSTNTEYSEHQLTYWRTIRWKGIGMSRKLNGAMMSEVSKMISELLTGKKMTQKELAEATGLTQKHVSQMVTGRTGMSARTAVMFERATGVDAVEWLKAQADDELSKARNDMPTPQEEAERYVLQALSTLGFPPEEARLTGRDKMVIEMTLRGMGVVK